MKRLLLLLATVAASVVATAQTRWHDPVKAGYNVIQNQAYSDEIGKSYVRFPDRAKDVIPSAVWGLSRNSAGLYISFYTNSPSIEVKYTTTSKSYAMPHMPSTGVSGVDMYRISALEDIHLEKSMYRSNTKICQPKTDTIKRDLSIGYFYLYTTV